MLSGVEVLIVPSQTFNWLCHEDVPLEGFWVDHLLADFRKAQGVLSCFATAKPRFMVLSDMTHAKVACVFFKI